MELCSSREWPQKVVKNINSFPIIDVVEFFFIFPNVMFLRLFI